VAELPTLERPPVSYIPPVPVRAAAKSHGALISFVLCVVLPVMIAAVYYTRIASPQFVAEFRFSVKDVSPQTSMAMPSMTTLLGGMASNNTADNYMVTDYLASRTAVDELQARINVKSLYSRPDIDWWSRFDATKPMEKFVTYWQSQISASYDQVTGLAVAEVRAFSPDDAYLISTTLVKMSEELINHIATRSQNDAVRFAEENLRKAEDRMKAIQARRTEYRNRVGVIDPASSVVASNSSLAQTLRAGLAQLETTLTSLQQRRLSATAPAIISLKSQIQATKQQLAELEANVGKTTQGASLSTLIGEYEQLELERQFAQTLLETSAKALEQARVNAAAQHLYVTPYVRPSMPESSVYPNKVKAISFVAMIAFMVWAIGLLIVRSIREHFI
jgi:capsular polysaccharide transport system permease protein